MEKPTLRIARISSGWSQAQLAQVADVSTVSISNLETGKTSPQEGTREKLEQALGVSIDWRMTFEQAILRNTNTQTPA